MTANGTLITGDIAHKLAKCRMRTVSVSIEGERIGVCCETVLWFVNARPAPEKDAGCFNDSKFT